MPEQKHFPKKTKWSGERYLSRIGLMPLTSMKKVPRRTGLPRHFFETIERGNPLHLKTRLALIERFERGPETKSLLMHPKLWTLARIRELAPLYTIPEIRQMLLEERARLKPRMGEKWNPIIPNHKKISLAVRNVGLRTASEKRTILERIGSQKRTRKQNQLSKKQRELLLEKAVEWISKIHLYSAGYLSADEILSGLLERFQYEVERFPIVDPSLSDKELTEQWIGWISRGLKNYVRDILRKRGIRTPLGNLQREIPVEDPDLVSSLQKRNTVTKPILSPNITFHTPLTSKQREIVEMAMSGLTQKQIAARLHITISAVGQHLSNIRKKARKV